MDSLRVMSFNVRGSFVKSDGDNVWENRAALNVETIKKYDPDLIGFQEIQLGNLETYEKELPEYSFTRGPQYNNQEPFCYPSIAWKTDRLESTGELAFWLSQTPETFSGSWDTACNRSALGLWFRARANGLRFLHLNTHLDHVSEEARAEGARVIIKKLEALSEAPAFIIVTGDFNCTPGSEAYEGFLGGGYRDAFLEAGGNDSEEANTFHGFKGKESSFHGRIDWILLRDATGYVRAREFEIAKDERPPLYPSDHYPVWSVLDVNA